MKKRMTSAILKSINIRNELSKKLTKNNENGFKV